MAGTDPDGGRAAVTVRRSWFPISLSPGARRARLGALAAGVAAVTVTALAVPGASAAPPAPGSKAAASPGSAAPYRDARLPVRVRVGDLLARMTLAEKIGQLTQAERGAATNDPTLVASLGLGSLLSGGGSVPAENTPAGWADMVDGFQRQALSTRLGIPILYGVDSVHGHGNLRGATIFPHNIGLGAADDPALVEATEHITAAETRASGPQWVFAPCICAARDDRWGRTYESFSENPARVERLETAIDGFQGRPGQLDDGDRVLATAKHYAGDGDTVFGTGSGDYTIDQGVSVTSRADFWRVALRQYVPAVQRHHVGTVMPSYSSVDWTEDGLGNPLKLHAHHELLTGVLKGRLGFDGFVISDWNGIHQIPDPDDPANGGLTAYKVRTGINAGIDMFMEPDTAGQFVQLLTAEVQAGRVAPGRIDDAVRRILTKKFELGLFEHPFTDRSGQAAIGSPEHRAVARRAVAESQVLLKNSGRALPLARGTKVYVAGSNADDLGNQAGGWTITWQGGSGASIPGTTILQGIQQAVGAGNVTSSRDASAPIPAGSVGVVVVGETPYSEGFGDVGGPQWAWDPSDHGVPRPPQTMRLSDADSAAVDKVCSAVATCVVSVVSGRPLVIEPAQLSKIDALVASWLPGSEGAGVADVLFGKKPFTGTLPVSWPRTLEQEPVNVGDRDYRPLFPYGLGLRR